MPSFHTRVPLLLTAAAGGLLMAWVLTPAESRRNVVPAPPDQGASTRRTVASTEPSAPAVKKARALAQEPDAAGKNRPPSWMATRDKTAPPRPGFPLIPPSPRPGEPESGRPRATADAASLVHDRPILRASTPAGPARREPASSVDPVSVNHDESAAAEPPLIVPYSPLDPSLPATVPAALAAMPAPGRVGETGTDELARLTEEFFRRIRGASENPQDAEYQQRWLEAQEESDARMRASLGGQAWLDHHREAHQQARESAVDADPQNTADQ